MDLWRAKEREWLAKGRLGEVKRKGCDWGMEMIGSLMEEDTKRTASLSDIGDGLELFLLPSTITFFWFSFLSLGF